MPSKTGTIRKRTQHLEGVDRGEDEKKRISRIKRSGLLRETFGGERPTIEVAREMEDLGQAFSLRHDVYLEAGYLDRPLPNGMLFSIHSILPETLVFVAKSGSKVITTMTEVFDTDSFGLPMDVIYRKEVDAVREKGGKIVELSALASLKTFHSLTVFMRIAHAVYRHSVKVGVNEICAAVVPSHLPFYKSIFLFEELGPERSFPKLNTTTVAIRLSLGDIMERLKDVYGHLDSDCNLYRYFHRMSGQESPVDGKGVARLGGSGGNLGHFLGKAPEMMKALSSRQKARLMETYPELDFD
jgi:hypothetical protein